MRSEFNFHWFFDSIATQEQITARGSWPRPVGLEKHPVERQLQFVGPLNVLVGFHLYRQQCTLRRIDGIGPSVDLQPVVRQRWNVEKPDRFLGKHARKLAWTDS